MLVSVAERAKLGRAVFAGGLGPAQRYTKAGRYRHATHMFAAVMGGCVHAALADTYMLTTGRRESISSRRCNTSNAIVSRTNVSADRLDGRRLGDPANTAISEDRKYRTLSRRRAYASPDG